MPRDNKVLCAHCNKYMTRPREQQHRKLFDSPFDPAPTTVFSQLRSVVEADISDHEDVVSEPDARMEMETEVMDAFTEDAMDVEMDDNGVGHANAAGSSHNTFEQHWGINHRFMVESDDEHGSESGDEMDVDEEGANDGEWDEDYVDWAAIEAGSGLSAWDRLGESFKNEAATTGKHTILNYTCV